SIRERDRPPPSCVDGLRRQVYIRQAAARRVCGEGSSLGGRVMVAWLLRVRGAHAGIAAFAALAAAAVAATPVLANVPLTRISTDTFTNSTSQHATQVEPDTFSSGNTIVSAFQSGRFN